MRLPLPKSLKPRLKQLLEVAAPHVLQRKYVSDFGRDEREVSLLDIIVPGQCTAIDVGANWGIYSLALAALCSKVICLEPSARLARILRRSLPSNCYIEEVAASDQEGEATLQVPLVDGKPLEALGSLRGVEGDNLVEVRVRTITLAHYKDLPVGFVKIDVEGAEGRLLEGARPLIEARLPFVVIELEERHQRGAVDAGRRYFEAYGYEGWFCHGNQLRPISSFDLATMQQASLSTGSDQAFVQQYVNNFLFSPPGNMTAERKVAIETRLAQGKPPHA